jgi:hypothetical protein
MADADDYTPPGTPNPHTEGAGPHVTLADRFAIVPEALLYDPSISDTAVRVYGVLVRHGSDPANCYPSHARIAQLIGKSKRSVQGWVKELEDAGWIERVARTTEAGDPDSNGYLVWGVRAGERGVRATQRGGVRAGQRGGYAPHSAPKESNRTKANANENPPTPQPPARRGHDLTFDAFWTAYPRKVGKPKARQAWDRALRRTQGDPLPIIEGARAYDADPNREDEYTAHPTTWLNRDGWNDPPLPTRNGRGVNVALRQLATRPAAGPMSTGLFALPGGPR